MPDTLLGPTASFLEQHRRLIRHPSCVLIQVPWLPAEERQQESRTELSTWLLGSSSGALVCSVSYAGSSGGST